MNKDLTQLIDRAVLCRQPIDCHAWLEAQRKQAVIDRVTDKLCPPEPVRDDMFDATSWAMRYAFAPAIKRPGDFGVIVINSAT